MTIPDELFKKFMNNIEELTQEEWQLICEVVERDQQEQMERYAGLFGSMPRYIPNMPLLHHKSSVDTDGQDVIEYLNNKLREGKLWKTDVCVAEK